MRICNTLTVEEMLVRLRDVRARGANVPDTGTVETKTPDTAEGSEGAYSLPEISELAGIPLYQLRYLRRRALLRSSEAKDPFGYTPGEKHRVRVKIPDLMDFLVVYSVGRGCGCACRGSVYCDRCVDP